MKLMSGADLAAIEARLDDITTADVAVGDDAVRQLVTDANTLCEQVHELRVRFTLATSAMRGHVLP